MRDLRACTKPAMMLVAASVPQLGCDPSELPPHGQALVIVDTDLPSAVAGRLRVDFHDAGGRWYLSRDLATPSPGDWPVSFGIFSPDEQRGHESFVRLRVYPQNRVRDYRGERFADRPAYAAPAVAHSIEELCAAPPELALGSEITLRRGAEPFTDKVFQSDCTFSTEAGSAAARVTIPTRGSYRFEVVGAIPEKVTDTTLFIRTDCADVGSQIACDDDGGVDQLSRLVVTLDPGTYFLISGGGLPYQPADMTLRAAAADAWDQAGPAPEPAPEQIPDLPRLSSGALDITPVSEPDPLVTIDRIVRVAVEPARVGAVRVTLAGQCGGTMTRMSAAPPHQLLVPGEVETCVATENQREPVEPAPLDDDTSLAAASAVGSFGEGEVCPEGAPPGDRICIPATVFLLGSLEDEGGFGGLDPIPERVARVRRFWIDRNEVDVARWRQAVAAGLDLPDELKPFANDGPLAQSFEDLVADYRAACTWSEDVAPDNREQYPVNCMTWDSARAFCQFAGGDLPTEAQWELAASASDRPYETRHAWGGESPTCERAVYGRFDEIQLFYGRDCFATDVDPIERGFGPLPVWARDRPGGDVTPAGVVNLGGSVAEWVLDGSDATDACWDAAPVDDPGCFADAAPLRRIRGGAWSSRPAELRAAVRGRNPPNYEDFAVGLRCAYPEGTP